MTVPNPTPSRPTGRNTAVIAQLRARRTRLLLWFWACVLLIPVGCAGPCGLAALIQNDTAYGVLGITGLLLPFVGLGGMLLMLGDRGKTKRALALAEQAESLGYEFMEKPKEPAYARLRGLRSIDNPDNEAARNLLSGDLDGTPIHLLDYSFAIGVGRYAKVSDQTVVYLPEAAAGVPDFLLWPTTTFLAGLGDKISRLLGDRVIEFPDDPEFNRQFALRGEDAAAVEGLFTPELRALCRGQRFFVAEVRDGLLALYRQNRTAPPGEYPALVAEAARWVKALQ